MGHGRRYAQIRKSEWHAHAVENRCNTCGALQWPSYEEVARGYALPSPGDYCPCNIRGERLPVCDGQGGADARHDSLDGNTCWEDCLQVSTGICGAQLVWNWEPQLRCFGGDLGNQKAGTKRFAAAEVVAKSLATALADAGDATVLVQVPEGSRDPDQRLFTQLHDEFGFSARWRGSWEPLVDLGMQGSVQQSGVQYDSPTGDICCSQIGNTCRERFCLEYGIQPDAQLLPYTVLGGGAGAFNTSVFVTVVDQHVSCCAVAVLEQMVMDVVFLQLFLSQMQATAGLIVDFDLGLLSVALIPPSPTTRHGYTDGIIS
ncbi:Tubulin alpha-1 chain [Symbiodinium microadriaticum]|uniref:Tubulin alpha-1 chain n=1 Tax=Symbiodinium microadriaticum TaxID=2951 RepID=A0A1Q9CFJ5_SYMMI|nr:Tubulin alpha-1 chain [Symbiodinium microadriaticum]